MPVNHMGEIEINIKKAEINENKGTFFNGISDPYWEAQYVFLTMLS